MSRPTRRTQPAPSAEPGPACSPPPPAAVPARTAALSLTFSCTKPARRESCTLRTPPRLLCNKRAFCRPTEGRSSCPRMLPAGEAASGALCHRRRRADAHLRGIRAVAQGDAAGGEITAELPQEGKRGMAMQLSILRNTIYFSTRRNEAKTNSALNALKRLFHSQGTDWNMKGKHEPVFRIEDQSFATLSTKIHWNHRYRCDCSLTIHIFQLTFFIWTLWKPQIKHM